MLKEKFFWWSVGGFFIVSVLGTINHFIYELSGENKFVALFMPVNESVWEHLKLLFFPFLFLFILEFVVYGKNMCNFIFSRTLGILSGILLIPVLFYIYSGIIGKSITVIDIILFFVSVFVSYFVGWLAINKNYKCTFGKNLTALIILVIITVLFFVFTFAPLPLPIFQNPG